MQFIQTPYRTLDTNMKFPEGTQFRLFKKGGVIKAEKGTHGTMVQGQSINTPNFDLQGIIDQGLRGLEAAIVGNTIKRSADVQRKGVRDLTEVLAKKQVPQQQTLRYDNSAIMRQANKAKEDVIGLRETPTTDAKVRNAFKLMQAGELSNINKKALDAESEYASKLQLQNQQIEDANAAARIEGVNATKDLIAKQIANLSAIDASEISQRGQLWKTIVDEERERRNRDELERIAGESGIHQAEELSKYQSQLDAFDNAIAADYEKHKSNEAFTKEYATVDAYKNAMYNKYANQLIDLSRVYSVRSNPNMLAYLYGTNRSALSRQRVYDTLPNYNPISFVS